MGVLAAESWCFCKGVGKSERMKAAIFSTKSPALVSISSSSSSSSSGSGFLIHRNLLVTTHANLPSVSAAEASQIHLPAATSATLAPHRFFITSSILDLTIVGLDATDGDVNAQGHQPHYLKTCSKPNLDLGSVVYLLGYTQKNELTVGEGKVVIATDNLIKLSTDGVCWSPGSAGFDLQGNLAFMICDPMKLATSPTTKTSSNSSSSTSSWKKDAPMQFGIPIPIICDWLNQHWEGSLDELNKPKLPLIRLMSTGQKSEHSCASFTMRQVFKPIEAENDRIRTPSPSNTASKVKDHPVLSHSMPPVANDDEALVPDQQSVRLHGISTPEIYETPKLTSIPVRKKKVAKIPLLDINFPPRVSKTSSPARPLPLPVKTSCILEDTLPIPLRRSNCHLKDMDREIPTSPNRGSDIASTGSVNGVQIEEVESCTSPVEVPETNGYSSEGETMYSAETAESRNYTLPKEEKLQQVGRSQSCVNHNRWGPSQSTAPMARRALLEKQRSFIHGRKVYSQGATPQRSNVLSPTVSSILKKRQNNTEKPNRSQQNAVASSRWVS